MGVQVLAIAVWLGSIALYGAAFFFPEVHRRHDFFWSGVGAFYGLVLWFSAVQTSSVELLGHLASIALLGWFGWQTLALRRKRTPLNLQTPLTQDAWPAFGRQLRQSALGLLRGTPLARWLPEAEDGLRPGDPAIATSEIRVSSLKDVDYEFVDELAPSPRRSGPSAIAAPSPAPVIAESARSTASPPVTAKRSPRSPALQPPPGPKVPPKVNQPATVGARLAGLKAWIGDVVKAKTTPKPKRAVIEIPPRPSPLNKGKPQPTASTAAKPSSPESSSAVTIVDTEATESFDGPGEGDRAAAAPGDQSMPPGAGADAPAGQSPADDEEANWGDDENWAEDGDSCHADPDRPD
ncbi:Ycf66 family protein [Nodosilinea nodulosa]|uniref:Ycf66 family protein n=1 Tax=Nodosilinea nodulosa TaxID=416001 RepID=UPI0002D7972F|nr:Ycf66 family protein [Nodosilinea nodulosa]